MQIHRNFRNDSNFTETAEVTQILGGHQKRCLFRKVNLKIKKKLDTEIHISQAMIHILSKTHCDFYFLVTNDFVIISLKILQPKIRAQNPHLLVESSST